MNLTHTSTPIGADRIDVKILDYISFIKSHQLKNELTSTEKDTLQLAEIAFNIIGLDSVTITLASGVRRKKSDHGKQFSKYVNSNELIIAMRKEILKPHNWNKKIDKVKLKVLNTKKIEKLFGTDDIFWSWILKQLNKNKEHKTVLLNLFEEEYLQLTNKKERDFSASINLNGISYHLNYHKIFELLKPISDPSEIRILQEKKSEIRKTILNHPSLRRNSKEKLKKVFK